MLQLHRLSRTQQHILYAIVIGLFAVLAGAKGLLPVYRSYLMDYLQIGDDRFGLLLSIGPAFSMVGMLFGGPLVDRWGPRRMIRLAMTGIAAAMLIVAAAGQEVVLFYLAVAVSGLFAAPFGIAVNAYLIRLFPRNQRRVISLNLASSSIGGMMLPLGAEGLLHLEQTVPGIDFGHVLHLPFLAIGLVLLAGSLLYRGRYNRRRPFASQSRRFVWPVTTLRLPRQTLVLALLIGCHGTADSLLALWMPRFLESASFSHHVVAPGMVLSGYALAYFLARGLLGAIPDRVGRRLLLVLPGLLGGTVMIGGILSRSQPLTAASYVIGAFIWSTEYPVLVSHVIRQGRKQFGTAMSLAGVFSGSLVFLLMNATGRFIASVGDAYMWMTMAASAALFLCVGVGGLLWLRIFDSSEQVNR